MSNFITKNLYTLAFPYRSILFQIAILFCVFTASIHCKVVNQLVSTDGSIRHSTQTTNAPTQTNPIAHPLLSQPPYAPSSPYPNPSSSTHSKTYVEPLATTAEPTGSHSALVAKYATLLGVEPAVIDNQFSLFSLINQWWGTPYCMGGHSPKCIDCSSFSILIYKTIYNQTLPRTTSEQFKTCKQIHRTDLKQGDLVFFKTVGKRPISHVGVYLMNNKFVQASTSKGVRIDDLTDTYWQRRFRGACSIIPEPH